MRLRFLRSHGLYRKGQVVDWWHEGSAREMIRTHKCEAATDREERRPPPSRRLAKR